MSNPAIKKLNGRLAFCLYCFMGFFYVRIEKLTVIFFVLEFFFIILSVITEDNYLKVVGNEKGGGSESRLLLE